jgi:hypothetical protein
LPEFTGSGYGSLDPRYVLFHFLRPVSCAIGVLLVLAAIVATMYSIVYNVFAERVQAEVVGIPNPHTIQVRYFSGRSQETRDLAVTESALFCLNEKVLILLNRNFQMPKIALPGFAQWAGLPIAFALFALVQLAVYKIISVVGVKLSWDKLTL